MKGRGKEEKERKGGRKGREKEEGQKGEGVERGGILGKTKKVCKKKQRCLSCSQDEKCF